MIMVDINQTQSSNHQLKLMFTLKFLWRPKGKFPKHNSNIWNDLSTGQHIQTFTINATLTSSETLSNGCYGYTDNKGLYTSENVRKGTLSE